MTTTPTFVSKAPATEPVHFVLCDLDHLGLAFVQTSPEAADETTIVTNMLSGQYEAPLAVIAVDLAAGTSRDVSAEIARKVELSAAVEQRTLADGVRAFVDADRAVRLSCP